MFRRSVVRYIMVCSVLQGSALAFMAIPLIRFFFFGVCVFLIRHRICSSTALSKISAIFIQSYAYIFNANSENLNDVPI